MLTYSPATPAVRHHMSSDLLSVEADLSIVEVAQRMVDRNVGAALVRDDGRLTGILTERDLLRAVAWGLQHDGRVADCMTAHPETIGPDDTTNHAVVLMLHGGFRHLPVVQGDDLLGVISIRDLVPLVLEDTAPRGV
jgi:CBS domain-containing protein